MLVAGQRINMLTLVEPTRRSKHAAWKCACDCGGAFEVVASSLEAGSPYSCGCVRTPRVFGRFVVGAVFGRLTVIDPMKAPKARMRCECGVERVVLRGNVIAGFTRSCGCLAVERFVESITKHGRTGTIEYHSWSSAKERVTNPKNAQWARYGGRGITMCSGWRESFERFLADMGERPTRKHSIDRKDNDGGYWCGKCEECVSLGRVPNCRWATQREQAWNTRRTQMLTIDGETMPISVWAKRNGLTRQSVFQRIAAGWDPMVAATTPVGTKFARNGRRGWKHSPKNPRGIVRRYEVAGDVLTAREIAAAHGLKIATVKQRLRAGADAEALTRQPARLDLVLFMGCEMPLRRVAEVTGVSYGSLRVRLSNGWTIERAVTTPTRPYTKPKSKSKRRRRSIEAANTNVPTSNAEVA
jgi:hypothetical protein